MAGADLLLYKHKPVGAAEGCDLLILLCSDPNFKDQDQDQKIAAFGSSYRSAFP
jgi:hypothetical protein